MIQTTFRKLHDAGACKERYRFLAKALGGIKAYGVNTPITLLQILDINGLDDALWALRACPDADTFARLLACDYAEHVLRIFETQYPDDDRPRKAIAVSRRYARGEATDAELSAARTAAWAAAGDAARSAGAAAGDAERTWQEARLRELLERGRRANNPKGVKRVSGKQVLELANALGIKVRREGLGWSMWLYLDSENKWRTLATTNYHAYERLKNNNDLIYFKKDN